MGALEPADQNRWKRFVKMIAFFILVTGIGIFLLFFNPGTTQVSVQTTSSQVVNSKNETHKNSLFTRVTTLEQMDKLIAKATKEHKPVIVDYYADWCMACKEMEATTFKDANVKYSLNSFVAIKADVTKNNADSSALKNKYGVFAPPYIVFLAPDGKIISQLSIAGEVSADDLNQNLQMILSVYTSK